MTRLLPALLLLAALAGCSGGDGPSAEPGASSPGSPTSAAPSSSAPVATPAPEPGNRRCYDLDYAEAIAPTSSAPPVACGERHTAMTFAVGELDVVVAGHLLAVDSDRVRAQVAQDCPARFASFVGGSLEDRRLSMLRPVWFTPTVEESDAGARWYRCDVVALAADEELAPLTGRLEGVLDEQPGRDRYAMCGTAEPGTKGFARVVCSREHRWRAVAVVPLPEGDYPGQERVRAAGQAPCKDAGAAASGGSLDYQWGYEWPTAEQWAAGQHYGRCWAPSGQ